MIIGFKDGIKLIGVATVCFCAVFVCSVFTNFYLDARAIAYAVPQELFSLYDAQMNMSKFVCCITGGVLCATAVVMLVFYVKLFIDGNIKRFGILKAMGFSDGKLASAFWVFGLTVFIGAAAGQCVGYAFMPIVYKELCIDGLPQISVSFNVALPLAFVLAPSAVFALLACLYARFTLRCDLKGMLGGKAIRRRASRRKCAIESKKQNKDKPRGFISELRSAILRNNKATVFFIALACFCFSAMLQMSASMRELSSLTMGAMMLVIGMVLAVTMLVMAVTTVTERNADSAAMMKAFGYTAKERAVAVLSGYVPFAALGFALGTVYQYALLRLMVDVMFAEYSNMPEYSFDVPMFFITLALFVVLYALSMIAYSHKLSRVSVKRIMAQE